MSVPEGDGSGLVVRTHASLRALGLAAWSELAAGAPPFLQAEWLDTLERTGCVGEERGWIPCHLSVEEGSRLLALAPAYLKLNSEGEFVFDQPWARFCEARLRRPYYPKLVLASPFTPATGARVLVRPGEDRARVMDALAAALPALGERVGCSSAHVLFSSPAEAAEWEARGACARTGVQFHWQNRGYAGFDAFLAGMDAKRRHQIRRERRLVAEAGLRVEVRRGAELGEAEVEALHDFYLATVSKFAWGRRYLTRAFFFEIVERLPGAIHAVLARDASGAPIAGAFNLLGPDALYGRYWGARREVPYLHFEVCFYRGIEDAIERGLARFEPGAGGEHKLPRGFEPTVTHSSHFLLDRRLDQAVRQFCQEERDHVEREVAAARATGPLRNAPR